VAEARRAVLALSLGRFAGLSAKVAVAAIAIVVFAVSAFAWSQVRVLDRSLAGPDLGGSATSGGQGGVGPTEEQNILLVGVDSRTDSMGNPLPPKLLHKLHAGSQGGDLTDTIIVIHIPAGGRKAVGFSIPRDSYVDIAGPQGKHKVNAAYAYGKNSAMQRLKAEGLRGPELVRRAKNAGAQTTIATVENLTGLHIDHYAEVNLIGFYYVTKAIGGVPICLKAPTYDPHTGVRFRAGLQQVEGTRALAFVRQRHGVPHGDLGRIRRQQAFMASLADKVLSSGLLTSPRKLHHLVTAITRTVVLDKDWNVLAFAKQLQRLSAGNITFHTIPVGDTELHTRSDGLAVQVHPFRVRGYIQHVLHGTPLLSKATAPPSSSSTPSTPSTTPSAGPPEPPLRAGTNSALHAGGGPTCVY
jgi:LCP family protein required for cell wall assembly